MGWLGGWGGGPSLVGGGPGRVAGRVRWWAWSGGRQGEVEGLVIRGGWIFSLQSKECSGVNIVTWHIQPPT